MEAMMHNYTLADFCKENDYGLDITGTDWDWGTYFECPASPEECKDAYDKVMYYLGTHIYIEKLVCDWYSWTTIEEFIHEHQGAFQEFVNKCFREEYIPDWDTLDPDSEEWYELFMDDVMGGLLAGSYAESEYNILYEILTKEEK